MRKRILLLVLVACALTAFGAVATTMAQDGEQILSTALQIGPGGDTGGRPWGGGAGATTHVKQFITPTIFNRDLTDIVPYAAESWESNDDFTVWTYHLHPDMVWSDGEPFTANDWKFTGEFITAPDFSGGLNFRNEVFSDVLGFDAKVSGETDTLEGLEVIDDLTIQYTLSQPNPRHYVTQYRNFILPEHAIDFEPVDYMTTNWFFDPERMVGSGPFVVAEQVRDEYLILEKNPLYFEGEPKLDQLIIRYYANDQTAALLALQAGEIAFTYVNETDLETLGDDFTIFSNNSGVSVMASINYNNVPEVWQDLRVRQAILYAIDREAITSQILGGTYQVLPCPLPYSQLWPDDVNFYPYDPAQAQALLAEAGVDPASLEMEWVGHSGYDNTANNAALQAVQAYLSQVGINFTYRFVDVPTFRDRFAIGGDWAMNYRGYAVDLFGGGLSTPWSQQGSQGGQNSGYDYEGNGFDAAIDAINTAPTSEDYFEKMGEFCKLHNELLPDLQLWVGNRYGAASKNIANFWWQPAGGGGPYIDDSYLWEIVEQ